MLIQNKNLIPTYNSIKLLLPLFECVKFIHIPRNVNKEADKLANEAMDKII